MRVYIIKTCALKVAVVLGDVIHITSTHHDTLGEYHDIPHVLVEPESFCIIVEHILNGHNMSKAPPTNLVGISVTLSVSCCAQIQLKGCLCGKFAEILSINKLRRPAGPGEQCMCVVYAACCTK